MALPMNFNDADVQQEYLLIPAGTLVKAKIVIKEGGFVSDKFVTKGKKQGVSYLSVEYRILFGPYGSRKVFDMIGITGDIAFVNKGKATIRALLESARGISRSDTSEKAAAGRKINSYADLIGLDVVIKIGIEKGTDGRDDRNKVAYILIPGDKYYDETMRGATFVDPGCDTKKLTSSADVESANDDIPF